jgi:serine/threonine protein kinase
MAKPGRIVIDHEDSMAALATWWKSFFLTPVWGFLVIMPLGAFIRNFYPGYDLPGFFFILGFGLIYTVRDLAKRRVVIDDNSIQFSLTRAPLAELKSISVASYHLSLIPVNLPRSLILHFSSGQTMEIMLNRVSQADLEQLVEVVSRRVAHCQIGQDVEEVLRRRRPLSVLRLENPDKFEAQYHSSKLLEELPQILRRTVRSWARLVGPVGTLVLAAPLWLAFNLQIYHVLRNYADVGANRQFYEGLVDFINFVSKIADTGLSAGRDLSYGIAASPVVAIVLISLMSYLLLLATKQMLGANRLTIDHNEISLDRFFNLFSFTEKACKWKDVEKVLLEHPKNTADPNQARINFVGKNNHTIMTVKMGALSSQDREKLSLALIKFCGESLVESNLTEALEPTRGKSYTELWLKSLSDTPARKNLEPLSAGHLLENSRYEIERRLAVGGEGVAYLGRDLTGLSKGASELVVLKETLIPPFVDKQVQKRALERFEREARLLKELESEFVVGLRHYFIEDHRCYLVLDYVSGQNLRQYISENGRMDEALVLKLAKQMCNMLSFLHEREVIHRDFTPDNLIMQKDGTLKLIDFNVAKDQDEGKTGTIVGKHAYVPPEQFRGKPTKQSDIYAMGATLHFLLTGKDPEPISQSNPAAVNRTVGEEINNLVRTCTILDTAKRFQSVAEVLQACRSIGAENSPIGEADSLNGAADSSIGKADSSIVKADSSIGKADSLIGKADSLIGKADSLIGKADNSLAQTQEPAADSADGDIIKISMPGNEGKQKTGVKSAHRGKRH